MGTAMLIAMNNTTFKKNYTVEVVEPNLKKIESLRNKFSKFKFHRSLPNNWNGTALVLAVKPQSFFKVAKEINKNSIKLKIVISIMAGLKAKNIKKSLNSKPKVLRAMPNLAAIKMKGVTCLFGNEQFSSPQKKFFQTLFKCLGEIYWLKEEKEMDAVTAISGSGPAYFFLFLHTMTDIAKKIGIQKEYASSIVMNTAYGAMAMTEDNISLKKLISNVCSKGGTTEAAINILANDKHNLSDLLTKAIFAAKKRSKDLSNNFNNE